MSKFAHRMAYDPIDLFYEVEVLGRPIKTKEERESIESSYFAMQLLIPDEAFMRIINTKKGGLSDWTNKSDIELLSRKFKVTPKLIEIKIVEINKKLNEENQTVENNIKESNNSFIKRFKGRFKHKNK
ncbi:MAG: hypothetical protein IJ094_05135 [Bacilli bacterium]|nr:hypothetical protein [Bacilli bacterium]